MIQQKEIAEKTVQELIAEALPKIPLYTSEWTNYNVSDPGITVLEQLSGATVLQQQFIRQMTPKIQPELLKLLGFEPLGLSCARVLLQAESPPHMRSAENAESPPHEDLVIPAGQKFFCGELTFETEKTLVLPSARLIGVYTKRSGTCKNCGTVLNQELPLKVDIFGTNPQAGDEIYFVFDAPLPAGRELTAYLKMGQTVPRNQPEEQNDIAESPPHMRSAENYDEVFAKMEWTYYTEAGFTHLPCQDETWNLLLDGVLRFTIPREAGKVYAESPPHMRSAECEELPEQGYVICGRLTWAEYDLWPVLTYVCFGLIEVRQKNTAAVNLSFQGKRGKSPSHALGGKCGKSPSHALGGKCRITVYSELLEENYIQVFCKEEPGGAYHLYRCGKSPSHASGGMCSEETEKGRYYIQNRLKFGRYEFTFREDFGYHPSSGKSPSHAFGGSGKSPSHAFGGKCCKDAVRIVAYNEEMMRQRKLGTVYGYDDQQIELPAVNIDPQTFSVIAQYIDERGEEVYDFFPPGGSREGELSYEFTADGNHICIRDAGNYLGANLLLGGLATTLGEGGNVLPGNHFTTAGPGHTIRFTNPAPGSGGRKKETIRQVKRRFQEDMKIHEVAVTAEDYETLARQTPGLCIDKVKALRSQENQVDLVVKPFGREEFPQLSKTYQNLLVFHLKKHRLLFTKVRLLQPVYVPVDVSGSIYVKKHYPNCREKIESVLRQELDYVNGPGEFGEPLIFAIVLQKIEHLECVEFIYHLDFSSPNTAYASKTGTDIKPGENCLCYPGRFQLEINTYQEQ